MHRHALFKQQSVSVEQLSADGLKTNIYNKQLDYSLSISI